MDKLFNLETQFPHLGIRSTIPNLYLKIRKMYIKILVHIIDVQYKVAIHINEEKIFSYTSNDCNGYFNLFSQELE